MELQAACVSSHQRKMAAYVTEEMLRWTLGFCRRASRMTQRGFPATASPGAAARLLGPRPSHARLPAGSVRRSARFCSQWTVHTEDLEGKTPASPSPRAESSSPSDKGQREAGSVFLDRLRRCGSPSDVLDLTGAYAPTVRQVSNCLTHMWSSTKKMSDEQRRCELRLMFEHPELDRLLGAAARAAGHMRNEDAAYALLSMVNLGVPQSSRVIQTFLRACQEKLNDFDEKSLSILSTCLAYMESSVGVDALKEGVRLVVEARLPRIRKVMALQTMMRMLGDDAPLSLKRKLERKALSMTDQFSLPNAQHMICTMAKMGFHSKPLLDVCSQKLIENVYGVPFNRLFTVLLSCRKLQYRNLGLLAAISDYVASTFDMWTNGQMLLFLSVFENLAFAPAPLMEAFAEKATARPDDLTLKDLLCVLKVYSTLNHDLRQNRQQFLDGLTRVLDSYLPKMSAFELLRAVFHLCLLGHFPAAPLERLLRDGAAERFGATPLKMVASQNRMFQTVDLCLRLDRPRLPLPLTVPPSLLGDPAPRGPPADHGLSPALLRGALEGRPGATLEEAVTVENAYLLDAVITTPLSDASPATEAFGEGEAPAATGSSQKIAVVCTPNSGFCFATSHPRGSLAVKLRHLKILGFSPVVVPQQELQSASEEKRTEFLRGLIFPERLRSDTQPQMEQLVV